MKNEINIFLKHEIGIEKDTSSPNLGLSILKDEKSAIVWNLFYKMKNAIYFASLSKALSIANNNRNLYIQHDYISTFNWLLLAIDNAFDREAKYIAFFIL